MLLVCAFAALLGIGAVQAQNDVVATVSADGPNAILDLAWAAQKCYLGATYNIRLSWNNLTHESTTQETTLQIKNASFPLLFWTKYHVDVNATCGLYTYPKGSADILTGPGAFLPLKSINIQSEERSAVLTWTEDPLQYGNASQIMAVLFKGNESRAFRTVYFSYNLPSYTLGDLASGQDYLVRVYRATTYGNKEYLSKSLALRFSTLPVGKVPKVQNVAAMLVDDGSVNAVTGVEILYTRPTIPPELKWWGVHVELRDAIGKIIAEILSQNDTIVIDSMPLFSNFTANVRAIFIVANGEKVDSEPVSIRFETGPGKISKPVITSLRALNESSVLVEWQHVQKKSIKYNYTISTRGDAILKNLRYPEKFYTVISGLSASTKYPLEVTAQVEYAGSLFTATSNTSVVTTMQNGALKPQVQCTDITGLYGLQLTWSAILPDNPSNCSFSIEICTESTQCLTYNEPMPSFNSMPITRKYPHHPFAYNLITVTTQCRYMDDVFVSKPSTTLTVFTAFKPTGVKLSGKYLNAASVKINYSPDPQESSYVKGYKIRWSVLGSNSWSSGSTNMTAFTISHLQTYTRYNISVAAFTKDNPDFVGVEMFVVVRTGLTKPDPVTKLSVSKASSPDKIRITWTPPSYKYTKLAFYISITDVTSKAINLLTWDDHIDVKLDASPGSTCVVTVTPAAGYNVIEQVRGDPTSVKYTFGKLLPPVGASVEHKSCMQYAITVKPPSVQGNVRLVYQVAEQSSSYGSTKHSSKVVPFMTSKMYQTLKMKARVCTDTVCSDDFKFTLKTNVGKPSYVSSPAVKISAKTDIIISWKKPSTPNGPIDGYIVRVIDVKKHSQVFSTKTSASSTSTVFHSKTHNAEFSVEISAFNKDAYHSGTIEGGKITLRAKTA